MLMVCWVIFRPDKARKDLGLNKENNRFSLRVTKTQRLIAANALAALRDEQERANISKDELTDLFCRMMVTIQAAGMGAYFHRGTQWSWRSRHLREPQQVAAEQMALRHTVDHFHFGLDHARGKAACRIRENRARRERELMAEPELLPEDMPEAYMLH